MGETDFTICTSSGGILVVEIKGGGVRRDSSTGKWLSIDKFGTLHPIKDPFQQARQQKFELKSILEGDPRWAHAGLYGVTIGYGVFLPDLEDVSQLIGPESPGAIIGGAKNSNDLLSWVRGALGFWSGRARATPLGKDGIAIVENLFCKSIEVRPILVTALREEEVQRITLTTQQARILQLLGTRPRARIAGGAGTGKTLIALEKARLMAEEGNKVLFVCYNRPLAEHIKVRAAAIKNLQAMSFHQLCQWGIDQAQQRCPRAFLAEAMERNPFADKYDVWLPEALAAASEYFDEKFDAIIVDEGQDFKETYWFALELLLRNLNQSTLFVFYDENQAIYTRAADYCIAEPPYVLSINCRNTRYIHEAAYRYYRGDAVTAPEIIGEAIRIIDARVLADQASQIISLVNGLLNSEGVKVDQIQVLIGGSPKETYYEALRQQDQAIPLKFEGETRVPRTLSIDTVGRFKGLEADVVILWGAEMLVGAGRSESLYVGLSRAKGRLFLVGATSVKSVIESTGVTA